MHTLSLHIVHRGAPGDLRVVSGARITGVHARGVDLVAGSTEDDDSSSDERSDESTFVPYHRFLAIVDDAGVELWPTTAPRVAARADATTTKSLPTTRPLEDDIRVLLRRDGDTLVFDGSAGEGGGQILRTALSLSMLTGTPFVVENVRAGRKKPGLMRQHLTAVKAAAQLCDAELEGAELRSSCFAFRPRAMRGGEHTFDIGTAGSTALVVQTIALPLALAKQPSTITLRGGTHAGLTPIAPFLLEAWLPLLRRMGAEIELELRGVGFYPAGGGELVLYTKPSGTLTPLHVEPKGALAPVEIEAIVAELPEGIARRELATAAERLPGTSLRLTSKTVRSAGPGNAIWLCARDAVSGVCNVFSAVGEHGVSAERVATTAADAFARWHASGASVEEYLADQLMLPMALAGAGSLTCNEWSLHARTNAHVLRAFLEIDLRAEDLGEQVRFTVATS